MELERRENESPLDFHRRLVYGKLVDKTLADMDYSELAEYIYGQSYSSDVARRMMYGSRRTLELMDEECRSNVNDSDILSQIHEKTIELQMERQKFQDQRTAFNKVVRERSRQEELNEILINSVRDGDLPQLDYEYVHVEPSDSDLLVSLNDLHYGLVVNNAWNKYSPEICKEMMRNYLDRVISIGELHHCENCIVYNCGDSISGKIHLTIQLENNENLVEQIKGASELIAEFLVALSSHFNTVKYISVGGNHTRLDTKENSPQDERLDDVVEWYLAARLQNFENIYICTEDKIDPTMFLTSIRGKWYCGVHGDYDISDSKIQTLQTMAQVPLHCVLMGHLHRNKTDLVQGIRVVMSGAFCGEDSYCVRKRIFAVPEQMVCVCDSSGIVCSYNVGLK